MKDTITTRTIEEADYMVKTNETIRQVAKAFGVSKSSVHKDLTTRLKEINPHLYSQVNTILNHHLSTRHLRGGEATRKKFAYLK